VTLKKGQFFFTSLSFIMSGWKVKVMAGVSLMIVEYAISMGMVVMHSGATG
jgi:hypothetical protein